MEGGLEGELLGGGVVEGGGGERDGVEVEVRRWCEGWGWGVGN